MIDESPTSSSVSSYQNNTSQPISPLSPLSKPQLTRSLSLKVVREKISNSAKLLMKNLDETEEESSNQYSNNSNNEFEKGENILKSMKYDEFGNIQKIETLTNQILTQEEKLRNSSLSSVVSTTSINFHQSSSRNSSIISETNFSALAPSLDTSSASTPSSELEPHNELLPPFNEPRIGMFKPVYSTDNKSPKPLLHKETDISNLDPLLSSSPKINDLADAMAASILDKVTENKNHSNTNSNNKESTIEDIWEI
ncbi:hypothetical protein WICMUC_004298 [Wickerhamomyces mucosus]|uniref:Uncharacterized protein n=1 Tax=Wickerhamomyces mucosus TaxID=1378264 RepID=A0A9P8PJB1_9ASCO|nr:hypothetical protein WICMUC_004298 [Wickerhamomyces mucosus]